MSFVAEVGEAVQTRGKMTFEWKISDFLSLSNKDGDFYQSPVFSFDTTLWYLRLYPNGVGETEKSPEGWVGLYLWREDSGPPISVFVTLGIKRSDKVEKKAEQKYTFSKKDGYGWGFPKWWSRSELMDRKSTLLPNDSLTVTCDLRCHVPSAVKVSWSTRVRTVSRNMKSILAEGKRADFTLKLGDREWPVHKVILESRCEYFANMFRHEWVENTVGEVTFDDMEEDALDCVLHFVYTGVVEDMSVKNVCEIYVAAHKFLLDDLKALCIEWMKKEMCVKIFCKVLVIADTYEEQDLNESATEYFIQEGGKIIDTEGWKQLKKNHFPIFAQLLEEFTKREIKKRTSLFMDSDDFSD